MRFLDQAIEEKLFEDSDETLRVGKWSDLEAIPATVPIYIFGAGEGTEFFFEKYDFHLRVAGVVDNDSTKWNKRLRNYIDSHICGDLVIDSPEILKNIHENCAVVITSIRYCDEIFEQIKGLQLKYVYSLLHMEANRRIKEGWSYEEAEADEKVEFARKCSLMSIKGNKIVLARDGLAGHGKQIFKRLAEFDLDIDLVWVKEKEDSEEIPSVRNIMQSDWKTYIEELETARIWLFGDMIPEYALKRPEQIYIQVKHWASITLKSFYFHLKRHLEAKSIYDYYRHNTKAMDYCMVGSDFDEETCRTGFDFNGEFIRVGSPRSDVLFQDGVRDMVLERLGISYDMQTLLYAPTFRSKNNTSLIGCMRDVDIDFEMLKSTLEKRFGGKWMILLRIHPDVAMESRKVKKPEYVIDVSDYPDSEELVAASNIVISDYSSIMFEPAFVKKPVFLYAPDADSYIENDRELLLDYYSLPFPISKSNKELSDTIEKFDENQYIESVDIFLKGYGVTEDGKASERASQFILGLLDGKIGK